MAAEWEEEGVRGREERRRKEGRKETEGGGRGQMGVGWVIRPMTVRVCEGVSM